jgi:hypothetical protein
MIANELKESASTRAIRLTIAYRGDDLRVVSSQSIRMAVPPSDGTYGYESNSGFWFEVRSEQNECMYRRVVPNPFAGEIEAPSGDPERPFTRTQAPGKEEVFVLLIPEIEAARELVLCGAPKGEPAARARPIAAIDLRNPTGKIRMLSAAEQPPSRPTKTGRATAKKRRK